MISLYNSRFKIFFVLFFIVSAIITEAQHDTSKGSITDTLRFDKKGERFYLGNSKLKERDLGPILTSFPSSAIEYRTYRNNTTIGNIVLLTGLASGVVAFIRIKKDDNFINPFTITLFTSNLVGIPIMLHAKRQLKKSAFLYNRELLK